MDTAEREYTVTTVPEKAGEEFTRSSCDCESCRLMHFSVLEWDTFTPKNALQRNMKNVVAKIERDIATRKMVKT